MYKIVYPETEEEVVPMRFHEPWEAVKYWESSPRVMWVAIKPQNPRDFASFLQIVSGEIVVVRSFDTEDGGKLCKDNMG